MDIMKILLLLLWGTVLLGNYIVRPPQRINRVERIHLDRDPGTFVLDRDITVSKGDEVVRLRIVVDLNIDPRIRVAHLTTNVYSRGRAIAKKEVEITWNQE
jgi:hypothetical protein